MNVPWFKFYAADYLSSPFVQALEPEQELWYLRLIIASAISLPRGCLPLANGKLWRLAKAPSEEYFEHNAGPILAKFERDESAGVYRVPKVAGQQVLASSELSTKRSEAGRRGAASRWQSAIRDDGKLPSETMAKAKQNIADSDLDLDSDKTLTPPKTGNRNLEAEKQNQVTDQGTPHDLPPESLAHKVIEDFHLNNQRAMLVAVAGAIRAMAGEKSTGIAEGCDALIEVSTRAQAAGKAINYLWFMNTGWREWEAKQAKASEPKKRPKSPMDQIREQEETVRRERADKAAKAQQTAALVAQEANAMAQGVQ